MFQRIAAVTVLRGEGECQAFVNGVVSKEIEDQKARRRAERRADALRTDGLLEQREYFRTCRAAELNALLNNTAHGLIGRISEWCIDVYALVVGTAIAWSQCLVVYEGDDAEAVQ